MKQAFNKTKRGFASLLIILITLPLLAGLIYFVYLKNIGITPEKAIIAPVEQYEVSKGNLEEIDQKVNGYAAKFEIYTHGTKRVFTSLMYHNLSPDVYISEPDPSVVHVKRAGITWGEFFDTLPFSLDKECLTTGTGQTFCNDENNTLKFILNNVETPNVLDIEINEGDNLIVRVE